MHEQMTEMEKQLVAFACSLVALVQTCRSGSADGEDVKQKFLGERLGAESWAILIPTRFGKRVRNPARAAVADSTCLVRCLGGEHSVCS